MTSFKDYPQEEYQEYAKKLPWYTWLKDQIYKRDRWKLKMEKELRELWGKRPQKHATYFAKDPCYLYRETEVDEWLKELKEILEE